VLRSTPSAPGKWWSKSRPRGHDVVTVGDVDPAADPTGYLEIPMRLRARHARYSRLVRTSRDLEKFERRPPKATFIQVMLVA
jgi:hypothetical protein